MSLLRCVLVAAELLPFCPAGSEALTQQPLGTTAHLPDARPAPLRPTRVGEHGLVLVTKTLKPGCSATVLGASLALVEAVREIDARLEKAAHNSEARARAAWHAHDWWRAENADLLA